MYNINLEKQRRHRSWPHFNWTKSYSNKCIYIYTLYELFWKETMLRIYFISITLYKEGLRLICRSYAFSYLYSIAIIELDLIPCWTTLLSEDANCCFVVL